MESYSFMDAGRVLAGMITFLLVYAYTLQTVAFSVKASRKDWGFGWFLIKVFPWIAASAISLVVVRSTFIF